MKKEDKTQQAAQLRHSSFSSQDSSDIGYDRTARPHKQPDNDTRNQQKEKEHEGDYCETANDNIFNTTLTENNGKTRDERSFKSEHCR